MLDYIKSFCTHPEPEVRVQMELQSLHFGLSPKQYVREEPRTGTPRRKRNTKAMNPEAAPAE